MENKENRISDIHGEQGQNKEMTLHSGHEETADHSGHEETADHSGHEETADHSGHDETADHSGHEETADHSGHDEHGGHDHSDHAAMYKKKFFVSLIFAIPILIFSPMMGRELPFTFTFPGSQWVVLVLATALYFYGDSLFYKGQKMNLVKKSQP